jgi:hypothetical protein
MMLLTMTDNEIHKINTIKNVIDKLISGVEAASILDLCPRQIYRLTKAYLKHGPEGLISHKRGKPSNNQHKYQFKRTVLDLITANYRDFGPTLAHEKLFELHDISLGLETLRRWMIADGLWKPHFQRKPQVYQPRYRRDCLGELIQIDGSHYDWFEGRSDKCCLLVYIDDATSKLMNLKFTNSETSLDYMALTREYITQHGKPTAFYSDKHAVFKVNSRDAKTAKITQFGRALNDLNIELICANSSQAKGRVERANKTLQDRLIKEMRLKGINNMTDANRWLPEFMDDFNRRFSKPPICTKDMHRPILEEEYDELDDIFSWQDTRKLSNSLTIQYDKVLYMIESTEENNRLRRETVQVLDYPDGTIAIRYGDRVLRYQIFDKLKKIDQGQVVDNKRLGAVLKLAQIEHQKLDAEDKRSRSKKAPRRSAQQRALEQTRAINPVLADPDEFRGVASNTSGII